MKYLHIFIIITLIPLSACVSDDYFGLSPFGNINNIEIRDTADVLDLIASGRPGDNFRIDGIRERQSFSVDAVLGQRPLQSH